MAKYRKPGGLKQQNFILSQFWRLEVALMALLPEGSREESFFASSSFWWLWQFLAFLPL